TYLPAADADRGGVGRVQARFFAGDPILSDTALVTRGRLVTRGAELQPGGFGAYRVAALVCDALENCVPAEGFSFGVDLSAPTVEEVSVVDRAVNPEGNLTLLLQDDLSGFAPRSVEATVLSLDDDPATAECGPGVDGLDLPGRRVDGA